jgi:hypothetical protein
VSAAREVHPAHQSARERKASKLVETLLDGTFGARTPTGDEIRHVLAQMILTPRAWLALAVEAGWGDMSHETRGLVCGMLMRRAEELDAAAPKLRAVGGGR